MSNDPVFERFNIHKTPYKTVNGQPVELYVMIPKDLTHSTASNGKNPLLVHLHGGFLVTGHALYPQWTHEWSFDYAATQSAIRISPNYRLLPESSGLEILEDMRDLFSWIETQLPSYLVSIGSRLIPDLERILVYGESAGGYLALHSGLMRPDIIKAIIGGFPMTYLESFKDGARPFNAPLLPRDTLERHIATIEKGKIVTGAFPPERMNIALALTQQGRLLEAVGEDKALRLAEVMAKMKGDEKVPFLFVFHGKDDSAVPCEHSERFVATWEEKFGKGSVVGKFEPGEHGFDETATVETPWLKEGLEDVTKAWIG